MNVTPLFVYGTLQPGGVLHHLIEPAMVLPPCEGVTARGQLFHVRGSDGRAPVFPVADFEQDGSLVGTLLLVRADGGWLQQVRWMEVNTGYEERRVMVWVPKWQGSDRFLEVNALTYHWPHVDRGPLIPHGDWFLELEQAERPGKNLY